MSRFALRALSFAALMALGVPAAGRASITPEAARVVARYLDATGGPAAFAAERVVYTRGQLAGFGFTGLIETWTERPARRYSRTALGPFKLSEGVDGATAWRTDPTTGRIVRLVDRDLLEARVSTWFDLERWAESGQGGGAVELAGHERDSSGAFTVLAVTAPEAAELKARKLWFSDATGLLVRTEAAHDQAWVMTTNSDWRMAGGRSRAFVSETGISSMPANRIRSVADSVAVNGSTAGASFALPDSSGGGPPVTWLRESGRATLPFEYAARHVWVRASVNGGEARDFLLDTGASVTVLDSTFAARAGILGDGYMQAQGAGASGSASFALLASLRVGEGDGVELRNVQVALMSVNPMFSPYFWRDMAGVLGYDFLSRFVVTVDYDRNLVELRDPHQFTYTGTETALPMLMNGVVPALRGTLDGRYDGVFRLDIGSSSTVDFHAPFVKQHALTQRLRHATPLTGAGFGGHFVTLFGRMRSLSFGPYHWSEPLVSLSSATEGAFASEEFAGNIGNRVLERFRLTLDYDRRRVWLEPGRRYTQRDSFTRTGLLLGWYAGRVEVLSALPGSPAARAGLREGDHVLAVDGRPVSEWNATRLDELLENGPDGRRVGVRVQRGAAEHTLIMKLKEMLK